MSLSEEQLKAAALLADPDNDLQFNEIADACGVTPRTLRNWRKDPEFNKALDERADDRVDSTLYAKAVSGDIRAIKEYNRRFNRVEDSQIDPMDEILNVKDAELDKIENDIYRKKLRAEEEASGVGD